MISYAQNFEDVVLARLGRPGQSGFYVDVGAGHPTLDSVTKHFYDSGWRGINIEPQPDLFRLLCEERPEDRNLQMAIGDSSGKTVLNVVLTDSWGLSTTDTRIARQYREDGVPMSAIDVEVKTLAEILSTCSTTIDFLKIDVEGAEHDVLKGADIGRFDVRVVVIEATVPGSPEPAWSDWEPILLEADYRCALFDGLNRFYVRNGDAELAERLSVPANVFDDFDPYLWVTKVRGAEAHAQVLDGRVRELESMLSSAISYARRLKEITDGTGPFA